MGSHYDSKCSGYTACGQVIVSNDTYYNPPFAYSLYSWTTSGNDEYTYKSDWFCQPKDDCNKTTNINPNADVAQKYVVCYPDWDFKDPAEDLAKGFFAALGAILFLYIFIIVAVIVVIVMLIRCCMGLPPCCCCGEKQTNVYHVVNA